MAIKSPLGGTPTQTPENDEQAMFKYLVAWGVFLALCVAITRTQVGRVLIYYALWVILLFLLVTQYQWVDAALAPLEPQQKGT